MSKSLKRKSSDRDNMSSITKRLKMLEEELKCQRERTNRRRRRARVIESSSSSSTSRESTPSPDNHQDGYISETREVEDTVTVAVVNAGNTDPTDIDEVRPSCSKTGEGGSSEIPDQTTPAEEVLDDNLLEILGIDPSATVQYGPEVHKELAARFSHIATSGLLKDARKELCDKYLVPSNCTHIAAPKLNAEIKAALSDTLLKRDKAIEARQKQLASAISCLAQVISEQLAIKDSKNHDFLKKVMDASRLLCDLQYSESVTRRNFASFSLKKEMKEHLFDTVIDKYLFGENLSEALKTAKAVTKSSTDLKVDTKPTKKNHSFSSQKPQAAKNLNWRTPAPARRQPGPSRSRPAAQRNQQRTPSKTSSHQQRTTRRR